MASSDSQIDKPQRGRPKRADLPDVNINTGAQSINTERLHLKRACGKLTHTVKFILDQPLSAVRYWYLICCGP